MSTKSWVLGAVLWVVTMPPSMAGTVFNVTLDTSQLAGTPVWLVFDFIDGDGAINNTATVTGFATDGTYNSGSASLLGDAAGSLDTSVQLGDSQPFSELLQPLLLGGGLSFTLDLTDQFSGSNVPDLFSLLLLDPETGLPLYPTTDPTGADALLTIGLNGGGGPVVDVYPSALGNGATVQVDQAVGAVSEPSTGFLWLVGAIAARRFLPGIKRAGSNS